jgi:hypothetical protein
MIFGFDEEDTNSTIGRIRKAHGLKKGKTFLREYKCKKYGLTVNGLVEFATGNIYLEDGEKFNVENIKDNYTLINIWRK